LFSIDGHLLRVVENRITTAHPWCEKQELHHLNTRRRRVLHHATTSSQQSLDFQGWNPGERVADGDVVVCIELDEPTHSGQTVVAKPALGKSLQWGSLRARFSQIRTAITHTYRNAALAAGLLVLLHVTGVILYWVRYPEVSLFDAFNVATVLIFDGYSNMFAQLKLPFPIPLWLLLFSLLLTIAGAIGTGILYAYITSRM